MRLCVGYVTRFGLKEIFLDDFRHFHGISGIKIILDYVPNHTSDQHEWFTKSEDRDPEFDKYFIWRDGKPNPEGGQPLPPNNWVSVFYGSAWTWSDKRQQYYFHQFTKQQPDLNYRHPPVATRMKDVLRFWLAKGVSGFRCDAVKSSNGLNSMTWLISDSAPRSITCLKLKT